MPIARDSSAATVMVDWRVRVVRRMAPLFLRTTD